MFNKIVLVRHTDLDGIGAEVVARVAYPNVPMAIISADYKDVNEKVKKALDELVDDSTQILIVDISVNEEVAELLNTRALAIENSVILIDHHSTAVWLGEKYIWANVIEGVCGTKLFFNAVMSSLLSSEETQEQAGELANYVDFAEIVNDYDLWIHANPLSKKFNDLYYLMGAEKFVNRMLDNFSEVFTQPEEMLLSIEEDRKLRYIQAKTKEILTSGEVAIIFAEQYVSELGHSTLEQYPDIKMVCIVDVANKKVSLRSVPDYDCRPFAQKYGGGGHRNSAGFQISQSQIENIVGVVFN